VKNRCSSDFYQCLFFLSLQILLLSNDKIYLDFLNCIYVTEVVQYVTCQNIDIIVERKGNIVGSLKQ
jgi:hypothetical protein